jgi:DNA-binding SARP family transcriptional activator/tetratricopeptide (TPR) repeat protein
VTGNWKQSMSFKIYLLGQFKLQANHHSIELPSRPAQSLLAYLALNAGVTHRREKLANLLWPEATESNARSYLRQALWRIRKSLQSASLSWEDYLQISDISVTFDDQSDYWLDADLLLETTEAQPLEEVTESIRLYRGELLPGFYEEWIVLERQRLQATYHQKMNLLLESLIQARQWDEALNWGEQWIRLDYSPEPAFRALMRAHAGMGDQTMVSATYQRCTEALNHELGLEPSPETQRLYEQILCGELEGFVSPPLPHEDLPKQLPSFLDEGEPQQIEKTIFVARQHELAQLDGFLDLALADQGRVVFITGEAGSGKTALIQEFTHRAQQMHPDLIVASGNCNAYTGIGDPYLPLREILGLLSGDVEARWAAGAMTREHARRLWNTLPLTAHALLETGPDLIDTFIPGSALFERASLHASGGADWLTRLDELVKRKATATGVPSPQQSDLFEQYTRVLQMLARKVPLVLVLDDLQWADLGSISLLFHLGRRLAGSRILILGAYRPEEVALGRDGQRHPLEPVVSEFQRLFGDLIVDVDQAESREFMEALLDGEPNQLGVPFRQMLFEQTRGQPLFTIELLRGMQERGDLVQDQEDLWRAGPDLDWETLPARVEAVVAERISRLAQPLQAALRVASVEGEVFTAEVVGQILGTDEQETLGHFSHELDRRHRLIRAQSILRMDGQLLSSYRFQHILYQRYLYSNLDEVERVHLHERVGTVLEELYKSQEGITAIAPQLARHFQEARITHKAIEYLRQAGERAVQLSAYQEGITHLTKGLALLMTLPDSSKRAQQELELQLALGKAWVGPRGYGSEVKLAYTRARELCQQLGKTSQLCRVLGELAVFHYVQAEHNKARELGEEALRLAQQTKDPMLIVLSHWYLGFIWFFLGEYTTARTHLMHVITFYRPEQHHSSMVFLRGSDAGISALAYDALCLWCLGYPDQAKRQSQEALGLARELDHPFSLADVLSYAGCMFNAMRLDAQALKEYAEELKRLSSEKGFAGWLAYAILYQGKALIMLGQVKEGIVQMQEGMVVAKPQGQQLNFTGAFRSLAEAQAKIGLPGEGLATVSEALAIVEQAGERHWEVELHRLRGEILLMQGDEAEAEASFKKAIQVARQQSAKSWELRASIGLARLWGKQGKRDEARQLLGEIYDWFTEGFDTPDLREAKTLLEELY